MLSKKQKIGKKLFDKVFKKGKTFHSDFIYFKLAKLENSEEKSHFTVVTPKKILKKAVERNLVKRKVFAILKENINNIKTGFTGIFFIKKGIKNLKFEEIKKETNDLLQKSNLFIKRK